VQNKSHRSKTLAAILAVVAVGGLLLLSGDRPQVQRLADGTEIRLNGVIVVTNAQYLHGKLAEKLFRGLIPAKGVKILQFDLQRPSVRKFEFKYPALVAVFQASTYLNLDAPGQPRRHRFLVDWLRLRPSGFRRPGSPGGFTPARRDHHSRRAPERAG
jgi:hypothetical protein